VAFVSAHIGEAEGNLGDWEEVYEAHALRLVRLATVLIGPDDACDLVSEAVRRAVHSPSWPAVRDQGGYLVSSLVNLTREFHRERTRRAARERRAARLTPTGATYEVTPPDVDIRAALERLSPQQRAVIYLAYWEDLGIGQIARLLDVSEGSVRKQLARAKSKLKELLDG
jgi:RNA polymerase sigma factor (sigma-70 family)